MSIIYPAKDNSMRSVLTPEHYLATSRNEVLTGASTWTDLATLRSKKPDTQASAVWSIHIDHPQPKSETESRPVVSRV